MPDMIDAERIKELEAEVAALKLELAAVTGENVGLRAGLEAAKNAFPQPQVLYPGVWQQPMRSGHPGWQVIPSPVNPTPWWTLTMTGELTRTVE